MSRHRERRFGKKGRGGDDKKGKKKNFSGKRTVKKNFQS